MERRALGATGHRSPVAILGGFAFGWADQDAADALIGAAQVAGVDHVDLAPGYGASELRFGPWAERERERWFVAAKSTQRKAAEALAELDRSLERIRTDHLDLWQLHGVADEATLDAVCAPGGAGEALVAARADGRCRHIGITGHGFDAPRLFRQAIDRLALETVMLPVGIAVLREPAYRAACDELLDECARRGIGVMAIKCLAHRRWASKAEKAEHDRGTWYKPLSDPAAIREAVAVTLSQRVTGLCTSGDAGLLAPLLAACAAFEPIDRAQQDRVLAAAGDFGPIFHPDGRPAGAPG